jgi:hypothetical protein
LIINDSSGWRKGESQPIAARSRFYAHFVLSAADLLTCELTFGRIDVKFPQLFRHIDVKITGKAVGQKRQ